MILATIAACVALGAVSTSDGLLVGTTPGPGESCDLAGWPFLIRDEGCVTLGGPPRCRSWRMAPDGSCVQELNQCSVYPLQEPVCVFGHCVVGMEAQPQVAWWAGLAEPTVTGGMTIGIWSPP